MTTTEARLGRRAVIAPDGVGFTAPAHDAIPAGSFVPPIGYRYHTRRVERDPLYAGGTAWCRISAEERLCGCKVWEAGYCNCSLCEHDRKHEGAYLMDTMNLIRNPEHDGGSIFATYPKPPNSSPADQYAWQDLRTVCEALKLSVDQTLAALHHARRRGSRTYDRRAEQVAAELCGGHESPLARKLRNTPRHLRGRPELWPEAAERRRELNLPA